MPRCCGPSVQSVIEEGDGISVLGDGSPQNPYIIASDVDLEVGDNATFNLTLSGAGVVGSPWLITVALAGTASIKAFPDVSDTSPTNGQVLVWNTGLSMYVPGSNTPAATGAVSHDTSLAGDGSPGLPLQVAEDTNGYLVTGGGGLGLTDAGKRALLRTFTNSAARTGASPAPALNTPSMLDSTPGVIYYWTGSAWAPAKGKIDVDVTDEFLELSGSYTGTQTVILLIRQISTVTDVNGNFDALSVADLAGRGGVLSVSVQPTGSLPFIATPSAQVNKVSCLASTLDTGIPYASQSINATVTAYVY